MALSRRRINSNLLTKVEGKANTMKKKADYTEQEKAIYTRGKGDALYALLACLQPENTDIYEKYVFDPQELHDFIRAHVSALEDRLETARGIYRAQKELLNKVSQLTID